MITHRSTDGIHVGCRVHIGLSGISCRMSGISCRMSGMHVIMSEMSEMSEMKKGSVGNVGIAKCECRDRVGSRACWDLCSHIYGKISAGDGPAQVSNIYQKRERTKIRRQYSRVFDKVLFMI